MGQLASKVTEWAPHALVAALAPPPRTLQQLKEEAVILHQQQTRSLEARLDLAVANELRRNPRASALYYVLPVTEHALFHAACELVDTWKMNLKSKGLVSARCVDANGGFIVILEWTPLGSAELRSILAPASSSLHVPLPATSGDRDHEEKLPGIGGTSLSSCSFANPAVVGFTTSSSSIIELTMRGSEATAPPPFAPPRYEDVG